MRSHGYELGGREILRILLAPVLGAAALSALLHAAEALHSLPDPRPIDNPDETLLRCKFEMTRTRHPARVVLVGDSSCAAAVDAPELARRLPGQPPVLNLGLIIGLGMDIYADALDEFVKANPGQVRLVVLLVTPQLLTHEDRSVAHQQFWRRLSWNSENPSALRVGPLDLWLGRSLMQTRVVPRLLHVPLKGRAAEFYGFTTEFQRYLLARDGSMVDPGSYHPARRGATVVPTLSPELEEQSRRFRQSVPRNARLAVGLTPLPESLAGREYPRHRDSLLQQWNRWLEADLVLTNLPAALPDGLFATPGHLNQRGQARWTGLLGAALSSQGETLPAE